MRSKVTPARDQPPNGTEVGSFELPTSYGRTKVVVLPVDPLHVHVYWEVTEKDRLSAMKRLDPMGAGRLSWVLRFHDVTENGASRGRHFDVFVDRGARNWYIELWSPNKRYWVELGTAFGPRFMPVSRSSVVELPRVDRAPSEPPSRPPPAHQKPRSGGVAALAPPMLATPESEAAPAPRAEPALFARAAAAGEPPEPRQAGPEASRILAGHPEPSAEEGRAALSRSTSLEPGQRADRGSSGSGRGTGSRA